MDIMNNYLTLKKILIDSVALYRSHFLYITVLIGAVLGPYSLIVRMETLPDIFILIIPLFILGMMLVEIVAIGLTSTSYVDREFIIWEEIKKSFPRIIQYTLITFTGAVLTFLGLSLFIIPGVLLTIFFNLFKVDYVISGTKVAFSFQNVLKMMKQGYFIKVFKIYLLPTALQFLLAIVVNPFFDPLTLEEDIYTLYPYITIALILIFPISICFRTSVYFNLLKDRQLNSTDELV